MNFRMGDKALFNPQDIERFETIGPAAQRLSPRKQQLKKAFTITRRHRQFIGMFARKRDPKQPRRNPAQLHSFIAHIRQGFIADLAIQYAVEQGARLWTCHSKLRPMLCNRCETHVQIRPQPLMNEIHMPHHLSSRGGGRGHEVVIRAKSGASAIIHHVTIFAQHHPIAYPALFEAGKRVGVQNIQESRGIRALDIDFAQR